MMIEVSHIKNYDQPPGEDAVMVESDADYVRACHALRETHSGKKSLKILVRQKYHFDWIRNYIDQTGISCTFTEKTPRLILAEKWDVTIPDWLDDDTVTEQSLLSLPVDTEHLARFEERLLVYFLGPTFYAEQLDATNLSDVVFALNRPECDEHFSSHPVLSRCLEERLKAWETRSKKPWVKKICAELLEDAERVWKELTIWLLLAGYPAKLLEYVLSAERILLVKTVPVDALNDLPLQRVSMDQASTQVEMFFKEIAPSLKTSGDFAGILKCTSGRLLAEFQMIVELLSQKRFDVSREDVAGVQSKFRSCPGVSSGRMAALEKFVRPGQPTLPTSDLSWEADQWKRWSIEEYIPYRHWQTLNGHYDAELERAVQLFSDWYLRAYATVHQDVEKSLVHLLSSWENRLKEDALSLILLVDSIPVTYWGLLQEALTKAGFHRHEMSYRFVPLPSHTENVKPAILSGSWQQGKRGYEEILKTRAKKDWGGKEVIYLPNLKALSNLVAPTENCVVLLNLLASDEVLHSDVELKDTTFEEELHRLFVRLADSAKRLFESWQGSSEAFSVYVITDHGASRILEGEKKSLDSKVVSSLFPDERYRFSALSKKEADKIPQNLWDLGYRFTPPFWDEDTVYFIPRGHNTVRMQTAEKGYVHGGATPEEVIVPAAIFKPVKPAWKAIAARFLDLKIDCETGKASFYIQRVIPIKIEVQNPNSEPVRILQVDILSPDTDIKACTTPHIGSNQYDVIQIDCYFNRSALKSEELTIQFTYEIVGEEYTKDLSLIAEFKSAVSGGFTLRDLQ